MSFYDTSSVTVTLARKMMRKKINLHSLGLKAIFQASHGVLRGFHYVSIKRDSKAIKNCSEMAIKILISSLHSVLKKLAHIAAFSGCDLTPFNPNHCSLPVTLCHTAFSRTDSTSMESKPPLLICPSSLCKPATNEHNAPGSKETSGKE